MSGTVAQAWEFRFDKIRTASDVLTFTVEMMNKQSETDFFLKTPSQRFVAGAFVGVLLVFVVVSTSVYMTGVPLLALGVVKLAIASTIPLITGGLCMAYRGKFVEPLMDMLGSVDSL